MRGALTGRSHSYKIQSLPVIRSTKQYYLGVGNLKQVTCSCGILNKEASRCGRISRVQGPFQHWSTQTCNRLEAEKDLRSNMQTQWESYIPTIGSNINSTIKVMINRQIVNHKIVSTFLCLLNAVILSSGRAHWDNTGLKTFSIQHSIPCFVLSSFYWCPFQRGLKTASTCWDQVDHSFRID